MKSRRHAVTGAFGYSGRYIAQLLLDRGEEVITLTSSPGRASSLAGRIRAVPFNFDAPDVLARSLEGVATLFNTYWVRFDHVSFNHDQAVHNTLALFDAAQRAGVGRIIHVSITNPSEDSPLPYFRGKARLERALREMGVPHSILRPAVLFGPEDILINNIAWALRRFPVFGVFGDGGYKLQPICVSDLAELAVREADQRENRTINAIGPETFTYRQLVTELGRIIGCERRLISLPPALGYWCGRLVGWWQRDEFITREEIAGLMAGLLCVEAPPAGTTKLTEWARQHAATLGREYANELRRRRNRTAAYAAAAPTENSARQ
ncbi:MAG: NAD(P)H-binding protein [Verrucomicrobia bacterium]|nr:NAD(P)H-binding protein [Verrucomicrobiota bacterium]